VDGQLFAVNVAYVEKITQKMMVTWVPAAPDAVAGITNLKGRVVTLFSLPALLGHRKKETAGTADAIVFKPSPDGDQLGLLIDKPGALVDIPDDAIQAPPLATGAEESYCLSGVAEAEGSLYRIVDIESISAKYGNPQAPREANSYGGSKNAKTN
jgi:chemotaxis signal transduction protein